MTLPFSLFPPLLKARFPAEPQHGASAMEIFVSLILAVLGLAIPLAILFFSLKRKNASGTPAKSKPEKLRTPSRAD